MHDGVAKIDRTGLDCIETMIEKGIYSGSKGHVGLGSAALTTLTRIEQRG
jgi:hypothetical protein